MMSCSASQASASQMAVMISSEEDRALTERMQLLELPPELLSLILSFLPSREKANTVPLVCKPLLHLARQPGLMWAELELGAYQRETGVELGEAMARLKHIGSAVRVLSMHLGGSLLFASSAVLLPTLFPSLEALYMTNTPLGDLDFRLLRTACPRLASIDVALSDSATEGGLLTLCEYSGLRQLAVQALHLGDADLQAFLPALEALGQLERLSLHLGGALLLPRSLPPALPLLEAVSLAGSEVILPRSFQTLRKLRQLAVDTTGWHDILPGFAGLEGLRKAEFTFLDLASPLGLHAAQALRGLTSLSVRGGRADRTHHNGTANQAPPSVQLPRLCVLAIPDCALSAALDWCAMGSLRELEYEGTLPACFAKEEMPGLSSLVRLSLKPGVALFEWPIVKRLKSITLDHPSVDRIPLSFACATQLTELRLLRSADVRLDATAVCVLSRLTGLQALEVCVCGSAAVNRMPWIEEFRHYHSLLGALVGPAFRACASCEAAFRQFSGNFGVGGVEAVSEVEDAYE